MTETAESVIANNLPTFSECYIAPRRMQLPSAHRLHEAARTIIEALEAAGFEIKRANSTHGFDPRANPDPISG